MNPQQIPLKDLHLPEPVGWWPPAPGWWLLAAIAVLALAWVGRRAVLAYRQNAPRRAALRELAEAERRYRRHGNAVTLATEVSNVLRRAMLAYAPRAEVAGLTGEEWLAWLDRDLGEPAFSEGAGRRLADLPYRDPSRAANETVDAGALVAAARRRVATPPGRAA